jgi:hypothetical protein
MHFGEGIVYEIVLSVWAEIFSFSLLIDNPLQKKNLQLSGNPLF